MDSAVETEERRVARSYRRRLYNRLYSTRNVLRNRMVLIGLGIILVFFLFDALDWFWPQYLGVSAGNSLTDAITAFHRESGVTYEGRAFVVGLLVNLPPYGTPGALLTILPPTLSGPTNTPSWWWWFGGTDFNLPLLPVVLASLKYDLTYSVLIVLAGAFIGTFVGAAAGYRGGIADEIVMRLTDVFFSLPYFIFALAIVYALGPDLVNVIIALVIVWWPNYARLARGQALRIKSNNYIEAAVASGSSSIRNVISHVIPNSLSAIFIQAALDVGVILQIFVTLGFMGSKYGFGLLFHYEPSFMPELGNVMSWGVAYIFSFPINWWPVIIPGAFIILFALGASLLGDGIRDVFDPKLGN